MPTGTQIKASQKQNEDEITTITGPDFDHLRAESLKAANECMKLIKEIGKMPKDKVVIQKDGMEYVFGKNTTCAIHDGNCDKCRLNEEFFYCVCATMARGCSCISATKITQEPKVYFACNRTDAAHLVGKTVEWDNGMIEGSWRKGVLNSIRESVSKGAPFELVEAYATMIREIPKTPMTLAEALAKYVPDDVEIVEVH